MISAVPFALQNGSHSAALFRQAVSSVVPNAGGIVQAGDLAVTQTGTPSMAVVIGVGRAWVPGTNTANFSGTTYSSQAQYFALNDAPVTKTVAAADPTNPRIDIVVLTVNDSQYAGSTNDVELNVITGTAAPSPSAPTAPANSIVLAQVAVAANATSITNANITQTAVAAMANQIPKLYASSTTVGSSTNLLTNLTNNAVAWFPQGGTIVAVTDTNGYLTITYPKAFPNFVITSIAFNGDGASGTNLLFSAVPNNVAAPTLGGFFVAVTNSTTGNKVASTSVRCNWIALGG